MQGSLNISDHSNVTTSKHRSRIAPGRAGDGPQRQRTSIPAAFALMVLLLAGFAVPAGAFTTIMPGDFNGDLNITNQDFTLFDTTSNTNPATGPWYPVMCASNSGSNCSPADRTWMTFMVQNNIQHFSGPNYMDFSSLACEAPCTPATTESVTISGDVPSYSVVNSIPAEGPGTSCTSTWAAIFGGPMTATLSIVSDTTGGASVPASSGFTDVDTALAICAMSFQATCGPSAGDFTVRVEFPWESYAENPTQGSGVPKTSGVDFIEIPITCGDDCGNGAVDAGEDCDTADPATQNCCAADCSWVTVGTDPNGDCEDNDVCDGDETCDGAGACQAGTALDCDDADACTSDTCDAVTGCANTLIDSCDGMWCAGESAECDGGANCTACSCDAGSAPLGDGSCEILCGNGSLDAGEACDDGAGNGTTTCGCQSDCQYAPALTACGDPTNDECTDPDTCDGSGSCLDNHAAAASPCGDQGVDCLVDDTCDGSGSCTDNGFEAVSTPCGDPTDDECTNPDSCDGSGVCLSNHETAGSACGDQGVDCLVDDTCDGAGSCTDNGFEAASTPCGDPTNSECTDPDTCDGSGTCQANHAAAASPCGDQGVECLVDDTCDGSGSCTDNGFEAVLTPCGDQGVDCLVDDTCDGAGSCTDNGFEAVSTPCGDPTDDECTNPDSCDGSGVCLSNHEIAGSACGDQGVDCRVDDTCDGSGSCTDNGFESFGTSCGDPTDSECTNPDTCDGSGTCQDNHAPALTACGDQGVDCRVDDTCDGSGSCTDNGFESAGTSCGDPTDDECTDPDTCDAAGTCLDNHAPALTACGDPTDSECTDPDTCDGSGTCLDNHAAAASPCGDQGIECVVDDTCDGSGSCTDNGFVAAATACDDGLFCNVGEQCDGAGNCSGGSANSCDDADSCTADSCNEGTDACENVCSPINCGDGTPCACAGEACDDGNTSSCDGCSADCLVVETGCGDGVVCAPEECDDGNTIDADDCLNTCTSAVCGDSVIWNQENGTETCDDGGSNGSYSAVCPGTCDGDCMGTGGAGCCGDGVQQWVSGADEECDDGNTNDTDDCANDCTINCTAIVCPSTPGTEQETQREQGFEGGVTLNGWAALSNSVFNGGEAVRTIDTGHIFEGYFTTQESTQTYYVWVLGFRSGSGPDRDFTVTVDATVAGTYDGSPNGVGNEVEWQELTSGSGITLTAGAHTMYVQIDQAQYVYFDGAIVTTDDTLNPNTDPSFSPIAGGGDVDLDDASFDYYTPGDPGTECCGDCIVQAGETCDNGDQNGSGFGPGSCDSLCGGTELYCGDGIVTTPQEECDGIAGVPSNGSCDTNCVIQCDSGYVKNGSGAGATCDVQPVCGDGAVTGDEICDTALPDGSCTVGCYEGTQTCMAGCAAWGACDTGAQSCGNSTQEGCEECDNDGGARGGTCDGSCVLDCAALSKVCNNGLGGDCSCISCASDGDDLAYVGNPVPRSSAWSNLSADTGTITIVFDEGVSPVSCSISGGGYCSYATTTLANDTLVLNLPSASDCLDVTYSYEMAPCDASGANLSDSGTLHFATDIDAGTSTGGTGDGFLDGEILVCAKDRYSAAAISGVDVLVGDDTGTGFTGQTDGTGCVTITNAGLNQAFDVTAAKTGYIYTTLAEIDSRTVVIPLEQSFGGEWANATLTPLKGTVNRSSFSGAIHSQTPLRHSGTFHFPTPIRAAIATEAVELSSLHVLNPSNLLSKLTRKTLLIPGGYPQEVDVPENLMSPDLFDTPEDIQWELVTAGTGNRLLIFYGVSINIESLDITELLYGDFGFDDLTSFALTVASMDAIVLNVPGTGATIDVDSAERQADLNNLYFGNNVSGAPWDTTTGGTSYWEIWNLNWPRPFTPVLEITQSGLTVAGDPAGSPDQIALDPEDPDTARFGDYCEDETGTVSCWNRSQLTGFLARELDGESYVSDSQFTYNFFIDSGNLAGWRFPLTFSSANRTYCPSGNGDGNTCYVTTNQGLPLLSDLVTHLNTELSGAVTTYHTSAGLSFYKPEPFEVPNRGRDVSGSRYNSRFFTNPSPDVGWSSDLTVGLPYGTTPPDPGASTTARERNSVEGTALSTYELSGRSFTFTGTAPDNGGELFIHSLSPNDPILAQARICNGGTEDGNDCSADDSACTGGGGTCDPYTLNIGNKVCVGGDQDGQDCTDDPLYCVNGGCIGGTDAGEPCTPGPTEACEMGGGVCATGGGECLGVSQSPLILEGRPSWRIFTRDNASPVSFTLPDISGFTGVGAYDFPLGGGTAGIDEDIQMVWGIMGVGENALGSCAEINNFELGDLDELPSLSNNDQSFIFKN